MALGEIRANTTQYYFVILGYSSDKIQPSATEKSSLATRVMIMLLGTKTVVTR